MLVAVVVVVIILAKTQVVVLVDKVGVVTVVLMHQSVAQRKAEIPQRVAAVAAAQKELHRQMVLVDKVGVA
jgi:adenosyl cobinamide kinase/adenosyl cobinamide phosphate guanylyltransferase